MKEIRFEISTGPREPYFLAPIGRVEGVSETVHVPRDVLLQLWRLTGPPEDVARFKKVLAGAGRPPHAGNVILHEGYRALHFVAKWTEPRGEHGPTLENLFATLAWSKVLLRIRARQGHIHVRAMDEDCSKLDELYQGVRRGFGNRWHVELVRIGDLEDRKRTSGTGPPPEDLELLDLALREGYYDEPKRCGVRELGEALGLSKSAVNRRLRGLERRAILELRDRGGSWPRAERQR